MQRQTVYEGCRKLVAALDEAVQSGGTAAITGAVERALTRLIGDGEVELSEELCEPVEGSYARRLVHNDPELGYSVVAMVWGIGQGTPLHDHAGMWCVEGVVDGSIEVTQYDLLEQEEELYRFRREQTVQAGVGDAGRLIPPYDYHTICNALPDRPSVTIHVYGGEMSRCSTFQPRRGDWYQRVAKQLSFTA